MSIFFAKLSIIAYVTNQSVIPESSITRRRHSKNVHRLPFFLSRPHTALRSPGSRPIPHLGACSQANVFRRTFYTPSVNLIALIVAGLWKVEQNPQPSPPPPSPPQKTKTKNSGIGRVPLIMSYINLKLATSEVHPSVITLSCLPLVLKQNIDREIELVFSRVIGVY